MYEYACIHACVYARICIYVRQYSFLRFIQIYVCSQQHLQAALRSSRVNLTTE